MLRNTPSSTLFPYTTLFRSGDIRQQKSSHFVCNLSQSLVVPIPRISRCSADDHLRHDGQGFLFYFVIVNHAGLLLHAVEMRDRKSTRLNSSHVKISYAVFCL